MTTTMMQLIMRSRFVSQRLIFVTGLEPGMTGPESVVLPSVLFFPIGIATVL